MRVKATSRSRDLEVDQFLIKSYKKYLLGVFSVTLSLSRARSR